MNRNLIRLLIGGLLAIPVAGGLFFIMQYLIASADPMIDDEKQTKLADIHMPDREIETKIDDMPEKVEDPEKPPPDMDTPELDFEMDVKAVNLAPTTQVTLSLGLGGINTGDGEYLPIVKVAPIYPRRAQSRGLTGYCIVEYTVTTSGAIRDPVAVDCKPSGVFDKASVKASLKFKYKPRVVDGEPIEVAGVQNKFTYELED
jgi:protein TonB